MPDATLAACHPQVIDALRRAWGSQQYTVLIAIDGPPQDEQQLQHFNRQGGCPGSGAAAYPSRLKLLNVASVQRW